MDLKINQNIIKKISYMIPITFLFVALFCSGFTSKAMAAVSSITIGQTDYDNLTMEVRANGNAIVSYSTDQKTWYEVEGSYDSMKDAYLMDISWVSDKNDVTLYFKGNVVKTITDIELPKRNSSFKVTYDKVTGDFDFMETESAEYFQWRKSTVYEWNTVSLVEESKQFKTFLEQMEILRMKGIKVVFRIPSVPGINENKVGNRPSRDVTITLIKRGSAPNVSVNSSKLLINTTSAMEYYDSKRNVWFDATSNMSLDDLVPQVLYKNGAKDGVITIRKAETKSAPYSNSILLEIKGQNSAPMIGTSSGEISYYYLNQNLVIEFMKATSVNVYEYAIVKSDSTFDVSTAKWSSVSNSKAITITKSKAPEGSYIYFRKKGTNANASKNIILELASEVSSLLVKYSTR